jgi:hypothetical protein
MRSDIHRRKPEDQSEHLTTRFDKRLPAHAGVGFQFFLGHSPDHAPTIVQLSFRFKESLKVGPVCHINRSDFDAGLIKHFDYAPLFMGS